MRARAATLAAAGVGGWVTWLSAQQSLTSFASVQAVEFLRPVRIVVPVIIDRLVGQLQVAVVREE